MSEPLIDIRPDHWAIVADILRRHVPDREVWAFGSRAKWNAKEYSDLDLAVIGQTPLSLSVSAALADDFAESDLPFKVDVVDWETTSESFRKIIDRDKVVAQEGKGTGMGMVVEELVGPVRREWEYTTLGAVCQRGGGGIQTGPFGSQLHASDYVPVGIPSIMPRNIGDNRIIEDNSIARITPAEAKRLRRYLVRKGDIVYSRRGDVERRALVREHEDGWLCGTGCLRVRLGEKGVDSRYASYYLGHPSVRKWVARHAHGATMPNLNTSILAACPFVVPPPSEQRAIAHILGTLDDKIELNRRMNETLEAMARALFKSWFVDFDPVRAKMEGRWRRGQSLPGLPAHLYDLFPARLVDSEFGEIPEGWELVTLAHFVSLNPEVRSKVTRPAVINYVDLSNTKWGRIDAVTTHAQQDAPSRAQRVLRPRDTIVGTVRPGNGSYAFISEDGLTGSTGFAVLRPLKVEYAEFVYFAATASENIEALSHLADGGAYPAVRPEVVAAMQVIRSGDDVMERFSRVAWPLLAKMAENERESRTLAALRDALLPKLITGELRVKDPERVAVGETARGRHSTTSCGTAT